MSSPRSLLMRQSGHRYATLMPRDEASDGIPCPNAGRRDRDRSRCWCAARTASVRPAGTPPTAAILADRTEVMRVMNADATESQIAAFLGQYTPAIEAQL